jgi:hypothetical protein
MNKNSGFVLLADVVGSRSIPDRTAFDRQLTAGIGQVTKMFQNVFVLPLQVWKGLDEVAAVLAKMDELYRMISVIQDSVAPRQFRFVIVKGVIDVVPQNRDVRQADGPAFHKAAEAMQGLKREGLLVSCNTGNAIWDKAYSTQVNLLLLLKGDWTGRQRAIYTAYVESGRQEAAAATLQVTQQTVSKTLQAIKAAQVQKLETALDTWTKESLNE